MKISDLKRKLQPGTKLLNTARQFKPEFIGSVVTVKQNTSLGLQLERDGKTFFMDWPKANQLVGGDHGFTILDVNGITLVGYEFIPPLLTESKPLQVAAPGDHPAAR